MPVAHDNHALRTIERLIVLTILFVTPALACNFSSAAGLVSPTTAPSLSTPTSTAVALPTELPASQLPVTQLPALAPEKTKQPPATPEQATVIPEVQTVKIFLVATGDNGASGKLIGCGDSLVPVTQPIVPTQGVLRAALEILLGIKQQFYGQSGLYNALYQSDLTIEELRIDHNKASIRLAGRLLLGGVCDNPRVEAQLVETAMQFSTVKEVKIFINGKPLKDWLSEK